MSPQGNPLNALAGGFSGGILGAKPQTINLNTSLLASPTYGPVRSTSGAPTFTQADYDRKYGITPSPEVSVLHMPESLFGTQMADARPGHVNTVIVPNFIQEQRSPTFSTIENLDQARLDASTRQYLREKTLQEFSQRAVASRSVLPNGGPTAGLNADYETQEGRDLSRLRYLQHQYNTFQLRAGTDEAREYDRLSLAYAGPLEKFDIVVNALAGFAGGYTEPGGTLSVRGKFPTPRNYVETDTTVIKPHLEKIVGYAQETGTPGHRFRTYREAITNARNPAVKKVYLDIGYNRALDLEPNTISPNRRPDATVVYWINQVEPIEVKSFTDKTEALIERNRALNNQIRAQGYSPLPPRVVIPTTSP